MKASNFFLGVVFLLPKNVWAIHPASPDAIQQIKDQLDAANLVQNGPFLDKQGNDISIRRIMEVINWQKQHNPDPTYMAEQERHLKDRTRDRDLARSKAIHLTLVAYGVVPEYDGGKPKMPIGTMIDPDFAGKQAAWIAIAGENADRTYINSKGELKKIKKAENKKHEEPDGVTSSDGVTIIFPQFFERKDAHGNHPSPAALASILMHEQRHFVQFTTPGQADKMTWNEREKSAHDADMGEQFAPTNPLGMASDEFERLKNNEFLAQQYYNEQVHNEWWKKKFGIVDLGDPSESLPHTDEELAAIRRKSEALDNQIQLEALERNPPVPLPPMDLRPVVRASVGINLGVLTDLVCRNPEALTPQEMSVWLSGFPDGTFMTMDGPQDCIKDLYNELIGFNANWQEGQKLDYAWLVNEAQRLKQQYAPRAPAPLPPSPNPGPDDDRRPSRPNDPVYNHCIDPGHTCLH